MTTNMNTQQPDDELQHWRSSVQDYISRNDDINLYIAAQNLNRLVFADPLGLFGLVKAQRHRGELEPAYFNITQARQRSSWYSRSGFFSSFESSPTSSSYDAASFLAYTAYVVL